MLGENLNHRLKTMDEINKELASEDHRTKSEAGERISEGVLVPHSRTIYASGKDGILGDHDEWDGTLEDIQLFIECAKAGKGNFDWKDVQEILIEGGWDWCANLADYEYGDYEPGVSLYTVIAFSKTVEGNSNV